MSQSMTPITIEKLLEMCDGKIMLPGAEPAHISMPDKYNLNMYVDDEVFPVDGISLQEIGDAILSSHHEHSVAPLERRVEELEKRIELASRILSNIAQHEKDMLSPVLRTIGGQATIALVALGESASHGAEETV